MWFCGFRISQLKVMFFPEFLLNQTVNTVISNCRMSGTWEQGKNIFYLLFRQRVLGTTETTSLLIICILLIFTYFPDLLNLLEHMVRSWHLIRERFWKERLKYWFRNWSVYMKYCLGDLKIFAFRCHIINS